MRYLFRGESFDEAYEQDFMAVLNSFERIPAVGEAKSYLKPTPKPDPNWDEQTAALWQSYREQDTLDWGIFVADVFGEMCIRDRRRAQEPRQLGQQALGGHLQKGLPVPVQCAFGAGLGRQVIQRGNCLLYTSSDRRPGQAAGCRRPRYP